MLNVYYWLTYSQCDEETHVITTSEQYWKINQCISDGYDHFDAKICNAMNACGWDECVESEYTHISTSLKNISEFNHNEFRKQLAIHGLNMIFQGID